MKTNSTLSSILFISMLFFFILLTQGRLISTPRYNGMRPDLMNEQIVSTSNDTVVIRDRNDEKGELQFILIVLNY